MKHAKLREILDAIFDRRLYGFQFFLSSGPLLSIGFFTEAIIYYTLNRLMLLFYIPLFVVLILVSGLSSKNYAQTQEVSNMGYFRGFLFLIASVLAVATPFFLRFPDNLYGSFQFWLMLAISTAAFTIAIVEVTVWGQRVSIRDEIGLTDNFFKKQKKTWEKELEGFPNLKEIVNCLEDGKVVAGLFDRGSFNLTVLWSCVVMEKIIDVAADGIISKGATRADLFKTKDGRSQNYPRQLRNLGCAFCGKNNDKSKLLDVDTLWNVLRNKVAHYNYKPTFYETYGALGILISFVKEMPKTLETWKIFRKSITNASSS